VVLNWGIINAFPGRASINFKAPALWALQQGKFDQEINQQIHLLIQHIVRGLDTKDSNFALGQLHPTEIAY